MICGALTINADEDEDEIKFTMRVAAAALPIGLGRSYRGKTFQLPRRTSMPLRFNSLLAQIGVAPDAVRLLRHQDSRAAKGKTPYELWRDDRTAFEIYQEGQSFGNRVKLKGDYWASFVVNPASETLLAGFYRCRYIGENDTERLWPHTVGSDPVGTCDVYALTLDPRLDDLSGRLTIEWGGGERSWIQRADNQDKIVLEIRQTFREPDFPGFARFITPLSKVEGLPVAWAAALSASQGVYLLSCPKTREQYVGSATGGDGFHGRWMAYVRDGHGGNIGLKSRDASDYQVSILEVAGSAKMVVVNACRSLPRPPGAFRCLPTNPSACRLA